MSKISDQKLEWIVAEYKATYVVHDAENVLDELVALRKRVAVLEAGIQAAIDDYDLRAGRALEVLLEDSRRLDTTLETTAPAAPKESGK